MTPGAATPSPGAATCWGAGLPVHPVLGPAMADTTPVNHTGRPVQASPAPVNGRQGTLEPAGLGVSRVTPNRRARRRVLSGGAALLRRGPGQARGHLLIMLILGPLQIQTLWEGPGVCISIIPPEDPVRGHRLGSVLVMGSILDGCQS